MSQVASDVGSRLPAFREIVGQLKSASHQGAFEGVSPAITNRLDRLVPVGLDGDGRMVLPDLFDAEAELPVLLLQTEQEARAKIRIPAEHCQRMAELVFQKLPITININGEWKDRKVTVGASPHINSIVFPGDNHKPYVTAREGVQFAPGSEYVASVAYLVEIVDGKRAIQAKFKLKET